MGPALDILNGFRDVIRVEEVQLSGAWNGKAQRRYVSLAQQGLGKGPYDENVDWRWDGAFEAATPIVGIVFVANATGFFWAKSKPAAVTTSVSVLASGWSRRPTAVTTTISFHGAGVPAVPVALEQEPPSSFVMGHATAMTGIPHVVAQLEDVTLGVLLFPQAAVKVGRNRLWHLREEFALRLPAEQRRLATERRSGEVKLARPGGDPNHAHR